jgi:hypothetical protein
LLREGADLNDGVLVDGQLPLHIVHSRNCHLLLNKVPGVSGFYVAFDFDDDYAPCVKDPGSSFGTAVSYDGELLMPRKNFTWSLYAPSITHGKPPLLQITPEMQFWVRVSHRDLHTPAYRERVRLFRESGADAHTLLPALSIRSNV